MEEEEEEEEQEEAGLSVPCRRSTLCSKKIYICYLKRGKRKEEEVGWDNKQQRTRIRGANVITVGNQLSLSVVK